MTSSVELASILGANPNTVTNLMCTRALDKSSSLYQAILNEVTQKISGVESLNNMENKKHPKVRSYVQHSVPDRGRHILVREFPEFDIKFKGNDKRSGATAIAAYQLATDYMINASKITKGTLLLYGNDFVSQIMRNRYYSHTCIPGHDPNVQVSCKRQDANLFAIARKRITSKQPTTPSSRLLEQYLDGKMDSIHCFEPHKCTVQSSVAILDMHYTDVPFRQIAYYMQQHGVQLAYMSLPSNIHMEEMTEGEFEELDGYVIPTGDNYITLSYKNAQHMDMTWLYSNYIELLARTTVKLNGITYFKECMDRRCGINIYKITANVGDFVDDVSYRSWPKKDYAEYYKIYAPVLQQDKSLGDVDAWKMVSFPVRRDVVDKVVAHAQSIEDTKDLYKDIRMRLVSAVSTFMLEGDVVVPNRSLSTQHFSQTAFAIYMQVVINKYKTGKAVSALTPYIREAAALSDMAAPSLLSLYTKTVLSNAIRATDVFSETMRGMYNKVASQGASILPAINAYPGYTEYSDSVSTNPLFAGWHDEMFSGIEGFGNTMPGFRLGFSLHSDNDLLSDASTDSNVSVQDLLSVGQAYMTEHDTVEYNDGVDLLRAAIRLPSMLFGAVDELAGVLSSVDNVLPSVVDIRPQPVTGRTTISRQQQREMLFGMREQQARQKVQSERVMKLTDSILSGQDAVVVSKQQYFEPFSCDEQGAPDIVEGPASSQPLQDLVDAFKILFPVSQQMSTRYMESEKLYSDFSLLCKVIKGKVDMSRLEDLKPDELFLPKIESHLTPSIKSNTVNVLFAFAKRNANTPADADDMDIEFLWKESWNAMLSVFYMDDASDQLALMEPINPNFDSVQEWVSKLDEKKRAKLEDADFTSEGIALNAHFNQLMLKSKAKPSMARDYHQSVKQPQTIQFDATGKAVAVFSPLLSQVVDRENQVLKPKIFVMQRKNIDDVNKFLNNFDHRPDKKGRIRIYIEIDFSMFDKSQTKIVAKMYLKFLAVYKVQMSYIEFIQMFQYSRWVSAMSAGFMASLADQNPSGASFTLHRNNFTTMIALSELFYEMLLEDVDHEFTMVMGDDNLTAVRGVPDVSSWEKELNRRFNLTLKITVSPYGYMCSLHIVHLPFGRSRAVADVVKRALTFVEMTNKDENLFDEKFVSFGDNTKGLNDALVQNYLVATLPVRLRSALPTVTAEAISLLLGAITALRADRHLFRQMFGADKTTVQM